jgi:xanthine dehydrogenase accessory factor
MEPWSLLAMENRSHSPFIDFANSAASSRQPVMLVEIIEASGSTPRDHGSAMLVTSDSQTGTIGGGQLEWIAFRQARELLLKTIDSHRQSIPLGPEIGQCCGGKIELQYSLLTPELLEKLAQKIDSVVKPRVQIHGAGHTGKALFNALSLLPFDIQLIDSREKILDEWNQDRRVLLSTLPETNVRDAERGTAFIVMTHEHQLDFLITAEALNRGDAGYVGMIGSKTKRAVFISWLKDQGYSAAIARKLVCPIGSQTIKDKRPEIIAALVANELIQIFSEVN